MAHVPCPACGKTEARVTDSRGVDQTVRRRRVCLGCQTRFTTVEVVIGSGPKHARNQMAAKAAVAKATADIDATATLKARIAMALEALTSP